MMHTSNITARYAFAFIFVLAATTLLAQVHYVPGSYGGYRTPIYGYQERDSTYRIIHASQTAPHTSPFGGIFEINQFGVQTDELLTGGTSVWGACYDYRRGKLIISDNSGGGLWQSDAITHVVDWEALNSSMVDLSILPDGRIVGYRTKNGEVWVYDTLGNKITVVSQPADYRYDGKFLPFGQNQFVNIGFKLNPLDSLNKQYCVLFFLDSNFKVTKEVELPKIPVIYDFIVTRNNNILLAARNYYYLDSASTWWSNLLHLIDTSGGLIWTDTITNWQNDNAKVAELSDGNYFYVGQGYNSKWLMFTKVSKGGGIQSRDSIGYEEIAALGKFPKPEFTGYCFPVSIEKTLDNGYYLVWKNKVPTFQAENNYGCWAMKFDSLGNFWWPWSTGVKEAGSIEQITIYPNPATTAFTIETNVAIQNIELFDITGHQIPIQVSKDLEAYNVSFSSLPAGVYLLKCRNAQGENYVKKILIE
ncbi:MAG: T9SS type A sorting domain-containing protein [Bacteroidia bacterium]|nr:T9SS type A sorting domain-containing protein [Bacteroidia bacterium]